MIARADQSWAERYPDQAKEGTTRKGRYLILSLARTQTSLVLK
jgi:hypothetical protein